MRRGCELRIIEVAEGRKRYLPLLLLGDESEEMIDRYIGESRLFVGMYGVEAVAVCAISDIGDNQVEVKNLAVSLEWQRRGIGRMMLGYVESLNVGKRIILGTGETPSTLRFYRSCGYRYSHRVKNFFTDNYPHEIIEEGMILRDMVYLVKEMESEQSD